MSHSFRQIHAALHAAASETGSPPSIGIRLERCRAVRDAPQRATLRAFCASCLLGLSLTLALGAGLGWREIASLRAEGVSVPGAICPTVVTTTADSGAGSLRSALVCATPGDTVTFALPADALITLSSGELTVTQPIVIDGSMVTNLRVSGGGNSRVFNVSAPATFLGFTVEDGDAAGRGGGLASSVPITLNAMQFLNNTAGVGGGVDAGGAALIANTTFASNQASGAQEILFSSFEDGTPAGWTSGALGAGAPWVVTETQAHVGHASTFAFDPNSIGDSHLDTPAVIPITDGGVLQFWLYYNTKSGIDGMALEINIGGSGYTDIETAGGSFLANGYNSSISGLSSNPLAGRQVWSGNSAGFRKVLVSLPAAATNQTLKFRWRMGSDSSVPSMGVWLDDVSLRVPGGNALDHGSGGGLFAAATLVLSGTSFLGNRAQTDGGGLAQTAGDGRIVNTLFARNHAGGNGEALHLSSAASVQILHTTIASPTLAGGSAIYILGGTVDITDTIVASHSVGINRAAGSVSEDYNLLFGFLTARMGVVAGANDVYGDPRFVNPSVDNYHLAPGSAAIDQGTDAGVTTDFDGQPRPLGAGFDIGFDEAPAPLFLPLVQR